MRAIILLQSIIILLGAYYIYTMSHVTTVEQDPAPIVPMIPDDSTMETHDGYTEPTGNPPEDTSVSVPVSSDITGPSDAGMEYPTMDEAVVEVN